MDGITAGFQYMADYLRLRKWAQDTENQPAVEALDAVENQWFKELAGVPLEDVKHLDQQKAVNVSLYLLLTHDPFALSRHLLQQFKKDFKVQ